MLRRRWGMLSGLPAGKWLFSRILGAAAPYTGTLRARVLVLEPGRCQAVLHDRRGLRNHLHSVHAMALANLAEMATGLALLAGLPERTRAILIGFHVEYHHKARGMLFAECRCTPPPDNLERDCEVHGSIQDERGTVVATARAVWRTGPES